METCERFFDYLDDAVDACLYYWPISIALLLALVLTSIFNCPLRKDVFQKIYLFVFLPLITPLLVVLSGVLIGSVSLWTCIAVGLVLLQLIASIFFVIRFKRIRWFSVSIAVFHLYLSFEAWFVTAMNVVPDGGSV